MKTLKIFLWCVIAAVVLALATFAWMLHAISHHG